MSVSATTQPAQTTSAFQRRGLSLRLRLVLIILAVAMPVFLIVALALHAEALNLLTAYANNQIASSNRALKSNVAVWLEQSLQSLEAMTKLPDMQSMDAAKQKPILEAELTAHPLYFLVHTIDLAGNNVARSDTAAPTGYADRQWFQAAKSGTDGVEVLVSRTINEPALAIAKPIRDASQNVVGVGSFVSRLTNVSKEVAAAKFGETGYGYIVDPQGRVVAYPDPIFVRDPNDSTKLHDISSYPAVVALQQGPGLVSFTDDQGIKWRAYLDRLDNGWGVIVQQQETEFLAPLRTFQAFTLGAFTLNALALAALLWFVLGRALKPIQEVANVASVAAGGNLNVTISVKRHDEIGALAEAFNTMIARLHELIDSLEQRIQARTEQLQASADVGRAMASILDTNHLLREIVNLITDRFGFYYAAVFLADNTNKWAVLHEATGDAGRILKERKHQLEIGGQSMVGLVMKTRKARIALAERADDEAVRFVNPLLPDTRSEIALPLMVGTRVIGALDVQSTQMQAFDEASAVVLQSMADQIAIALSNARLFQQTQAGLQRTRQLYEASTAISNAEDAANILQELMTKGVPDAAAAQILTYGPQDETGHYAYFEVAASWGQAGSELLLPTGTRVGPDQVPPIPALASEPYLIRDAADPATSPAQQQIMQAMHMGAMLGYALVAGAQPIGLLLIVYREPRLFMAAETQPLQALAGQVAVTLRNQQLVRDEVAVVKQLDETNRRLISQAWHEYARATDAVTYKEDVGPVANASSETTPTVLSTPITIHGEEVGVLRLEDTAPDRKWTPSELTLARAVAGEVAIALENVRLIEQTERRAQHERLVAEVSSRMFAANDLESIVQIAGEELGRILRVNRTEVRISSTFSEPAADAITLPQPN